MNEQHAPYGGMHQPEFEVGDRMAKALRELIAEIRAYQSPECDDPGAIGAPELKAADVALLDWEKMRGRPA